MGFLRLSFFSNARLRNWFSTSRQFHGRKSPRENTPAKLRSAMPVINVLLEQMFNLIFAGRARNYLINGRLAFEAIDSLLDNQFIRDLITA